jgi:hypothetical protein
MSDTTVHAKCVVCDKFNIHNAYIYCAVCYQKLEKEIERLKEENKKLLLEVKCLLGRHDSSDQ